MTDDATTTPKAQRLSHQGRLALIGIGVAVVVAAVSISGWWIATNGHRATASGATSAEGNAPGAPTATAIPKKVAPNQTFQSPSGNIRCSIGLFAGRPGAICGQMSINYAVPTGACASDQAAVFIGVDPDGAYWPCVGEWYPSQQTLAYDTPITQSGITCTIDLATGVKCVNAAGKGFTMEHNAGITTF